MKRFHITVLSPDGDVLFEDKTSESWAVSNMQAFLDIWLTQMFTGEVKNILIEGEG